MVQVNSNHRSTPVVVKGHRANPVLTSIGIISLSLITLQSPCNQSVDARQGGQACFERCALAIVERSKDILVVHCLPQVDFQRRPLQNSSNDNLFKADQRV